MIIQKSFYHGKRKRVKRRNSLNQCKLPQLVHLVQYIIDSLYNMPLLLELFGFCPLTASLSVIADPRITI